MKKIIYVFILMMIFINLIMPKVIATDDETLEEQQEEFGIGEFIEKTEEYSGEFFEDINISEMLDNAIKGEVDNQTILKKVLNLLGGQLVNGLTILGSVLAIVIIHSILKSVSERLDNTTISKLIYYVQYILIVTIIMMNFSDIVQVVKDTCNNLVGFMNILIPLLISLMIYTGSITTSGI